MRIQPISFKKTLIKNCTIPDKKNHPTPCAIYKLDLPEDNDYFSKVLEDKKWKNSQFLEGLNYSTQIYGEYGDSYVLESANGDCLGYVCTSDNKKTKIKDVDYLETCPNFARRNVRRDLRYIGETLLAFVVELADENNFECVRIPNALKRATKFYTEKCGFEQDPKFETSKILLEKDYDKFLEQNKKHTEN